MDAQLTALVILAFAAVLQVGAALIAVLIIRVSGRRWFWVLIAVAMMLQAWRRVYPLLNPSQTETLSQATAALLVSVLLCAGLLGARSLLTAQARRVRHMDDVGLMGTRYLNFARIMIVNLDRGGRIVGMNAQALQVVGCELDDVAGKDWFGTFVPENVRRTVREGFDQLMESEDADDAYVEYPFVDTRGEVHQAVWHRRILRDGEGRIAGVRSSGIDVTDRKRVEDELAFRSLLLDRTTDCVIATEPDGTILYANDPTCALKGQQRERLIGRNVRELIAPNLLREFDGEIDTMRAKRTAIFESQFINAPGNVVPVELRGHLVREAGADVLVFVALDISERKEAEKAVRHMAYHDILTGLPNRALLVDRAQMVLDHARRHREPVSLIFLDVDNLKVINDSLGHSLADEVLRNLAARLRDMFRGGDTIARFGGDEFVILLPYTGRDAAGKAARKVLTIGRETIEVFGELITPTVSIGVAVYPEDGMDLDALLARADEAMYAAKKGGKDQFRFHEPSLSPEVLE